MPETEVLAGVKGPRVGPGSDLVGWGINGHGSQALEPKNDQVEQLAANTLTIPQDVIASLLQRLVRAASHSQQWRWTTIPNPSSAANANTSPHNSR
jgi:hypothetical protein